MVDFDKLSSYRKLQDLAKNPVDLAHDQLTPKRLEKLAAHSCGYTLLYGTERVNEEVISQLLALAQEAGALDKMARMQNGEVINKIEGFPSENRRVLHTAARDFFVPNRSKEAQDAAALAKREVEKLHNFLPELEKRFTDFVMVGIGGSDLGPRANYLALRYLQKRGRKVHFISNVDPDDAAAVMQEIDLNRCVVAVVSKSGTTLETLANEKLLRRLFEAAGLKSRHHFIAITGEGSPMDDPSNYLKSFYIWDWIGGRYSSTSMIGGVMLAFACGFDVFMEWLRGASEMDKAALHSDLKQNLPLLAALLGIWNRNFLGYPTVAIIPYSQALQRFPAHLQQLDMESNGKRIDRFGRPVPFNTGPVIWGEPGTNAQHSFFQLLHQGKEVIPTVFIGYSTAQYQEDLVVEGTTSQEKLLGNLFAQAIALAQGKQDENPNRVFPGNRPSHLLLSSQLTPYSLGALLSLFEHKTAFQGFIWNINSFDQEGVQLGKVLAGKMLSHFQTKRGTATQPIPFPLGEALMKHLENE